MIREINETNRFSKKMFQKVNRITHVSAVIVIILLILYGHNIKKFDASALIGLTAMLWFAAVFCSHPKSHKKKKQGSGIIS